MTEEALRKAYDIAADDFLHTRTKGTETSGFQNREVEQPTMYSLVPSRLKGKRLLDLGCGPGIHAKEYLKRGAEIHGIDISQKMILLARKNCPEADFKTGSCYNTPYPDAHFDIVTASFVLDHLEDLEKGLREVYRVLKPHGIFIFSVPHPTGNMFRESTNGSFIPSHSYYDPSVIMCNIVNNGKLFPDYPHILEDYMRIPLALGFKLKTFLENRPNPSWLKKYPDLDTNYLKVPFLCFFSWQKE